MYYSIPSRRVLRDFGFWIAISKIRLAGFFDLGSLGSSLDSRRSFTKYYYLTVHPVKMTNKGKKLRKQKRKQERQLERKAAAQKKTNKVPKLLPEALIGKKKRAAREAHTSSSSSSSSSSFSSSSSSSTNSNRQGQPPKKKAKLSNSKKNNNPNNNNVKKAKKQAVAAPPLEKKTLKKKAQAKPKPTQSTSSKESKFFDVSSQTPFNTSRDFFRWLIYPMSINTFFKEYYEKKPLIIQRNSRSTNIQGIYIYLS